MADHAVVYEMQMNRSNGNLGLPPAVVQTDEANRILLSGGGGFYTSADLPLPVIPPSGHGPRAAAPVTTHMWPFVFKVIGMVEVSQAAPPGSVPPGPHAGIYTYASEAGEFFWVINGVAFTNGLIPTIEPVAGGAALGGRISRRDRLVFGDNAGIALEATGAPQVAHVHVENKYPRLNPYQNLSHYLEFADVPPNNIPGGTVAFPNWDMGDALHTQLEGLNAGGARFELGEAGGQTLFANDCAFAAVAPEGAVYIRPEDFGGAQADRIPAQFADNEASRFRFHPSVFIRRAAYVRGLSCNFADPTPVDQVDTLSNQVMRVVTVEVTPGYSSWLIIIDGEAQVVRLDHPVGSDLRRPRDIWNEVWVPLIAGSNAVARAVDLNLFLIPGGVGLSATTQVVTDRLRFLEYARCLPLAGTEQNQGQPS